MSAKMTCPSCGREMNLHAEKLVYSEGTGDVVTQLQEMYACPHCGRSQSRVTGTGEINPRA